MCLWTVRGFDDLHWRNENDGCWNLGRRKKSIRVRGAKSPTDSNRLCGPEESVTKPVSSAEAESLCSTLAFPALTRWANEYRRSAASERFVPPLWIRARIVTASEAPLFLR